MQKNKFRASYSVLRLWEQGKWQEAIQAYFKLDRFQTEQMAEGKKYHDLWKEETLKTGCLPEVFGGKKLIDPIVEKKQVVQVFDWLELVGIIDCYDSSVIHEYKTGLTNSQEYARSAQIPLYGVLAVLSDLPAKKAEIHHYNQYDKTADMFIVWITDKLIKYGYEWLRTYALEMHNYLTDNNLYAELGNNANQGMASISEKNINPIL